MSFAPPVHSDSAIYKGSPFNTNLNASPGVLVLGGAVTAPAGTIAADKALGIDADGKIVTGDAGGGGAGVDPVERQIDNTGANAITASCEFTDSVDFQNTTTKFSGVVTGVPAAGGALSVDAAGVLVKSAASSGVDPVERLAANPNTVAATNPVAAACDFTGACNFVTSTDVGPTGPFVRAGRRLDLYDPSVSTDQAVIQYSATTRGQGSGFPGLRKGLSLYSGATTGRTIALHLTNETQNKPVCVLSRDNDETEMVVKSFGTNDVSILTVKATNDFTASPAVDHCVINMTSQTTDTGTRANTCSLKYVPDQLDLAEGTLTIDRNLQVSGALGVGSPTDANPVEVAQVESTTVWEELVLGSDFAQHGSDKAEYSVTTFTKLGVGGAANETFKRVDFRGIAQFTSVNAAGGSIVFNFADQTPALPNTGRRHIVKVCYFVPNNTLTNSSKQVNMPTTLFYRDIGSGVYAARAGENGAVIGVDPTVAAGTNNQILDAGYGIIGSEIVLDNTFYFSN